jgi:serine/threonine-protein kinase
MDSAGWQRVAERFDELCDLPAGEREERLRRLAAQDAALAAEVRALLAADAAATGVLARGAQALAPDPAIEDAETLARPPGDGPAVDGGLASGSRIGPWRLGERLGAGGMGEVWAAERADGAFEQRVAVKLLRRGLESESLLRRFLLERRILARLVHPGIARLLDAGSTPDGRPYFVMERVEGRPITEWADERGLAVDERLRRVIAVADAVDFAHRNLVVHRDLKPSNVLVSAAGEVKLLDFGIAKLLEPDEGTQATELEARALTPAYAAPEQIRGEAVTTATDVYALGVLLYELLTGRLPHRRASRSLPLLAVELEHETIERPSLAVQRPPPGGAASAVDGARRSRRLAGDLDTIVLKALAREPERRYASAAALADDLRRHLAGRPIAARPDRLGYRVGKFVKRHAAAVTAGAALVVLAALVATAYTVRVTRERDRARLERQKAEQVSGFLQSLFELSDLDRTRGTKLSARDILDRGAERIDKDLAGQPEVAASMMHLIGSVYRELDLTDPARKLLESALATRRRLFGERDAEVAIYERELAALIYFSGDFEPALDLLDRALATQESLLGPDDLEVAKTLKVLGYTLKSAGRNEEARAAFERSVAILERAGAAAEGPLAEVFMSYGLFLTHIDEPRRAIPIHRREIEIESRLRGPGSPSVGYGYLNLGIACRMAGLFDDALEANAHALAIAEQTFGRKHTFYANVLTETASDWLAKGEIPRARALYEQAIAVKDEVLGPDHINTLSSRRALAILLVTHGEERAGLTLFEQVLAGREKVYAADHPRVGESLFDVAKVRTGLGDDRGAEAMMRRGLEIFRRKLAPDSFDLASGLDDLGEFLCAHGHPAEGRPMIEEAIAAFTRNPSAYAPDLGTMAATARRCVASSS